MSDSSGVRRRSSIHITRQRASRLYLLVRLLQERAQSRDEVLRALGIGLRTFYRELDLLKRCGLKVNHNDKLYSLGAPRGSAEGRIPFPDPQLSFAEMAELARCDCDAGRRLAALLAQVIDQAAPASPRKARKPRG